MKNFTLIACLTLGLISCSNTGYEKKIPRCPGVNPSPAEPRMYKE